MSRAGTTHTLRNAIPGPDDIQRVELPNGLVILSRTNFESPSVVIDGYLPAGALYETDEKLGLADFTSLALMRGTQKRSFQQIYADLEAAGASLGYDSGVHTAGFHGRALAEDIDLLLELLGETLRQPVFPEDAVERLRAQLLTGLAIRAQDTAEMVSLAFDQIVYRGHPYSRPEDGYPETIQAITQADLVDFHRRCYGPRGMVLVIVGAVEARQAVEKAARLLGDWHNPSQPAPPALPPVQPLEGRAWQRVPIPGKFQSDLLVGAAGPERRAKDYLAASLGNNILGQFGMMGRIGQVVREEAGLAYSAGSSLSGGPGPGPWDISAGVAPEDVDETVELILQEVKRFTSAPVSAEEMADSESNFIGRLPISLESNGGVAAALANIERYQLGADYYRRYPDLVRAVTAEDILQAAQHYLDVDRLCVAVAGPS